MSTLDKTFAELLREAEPYLLTCDYVGKERKKKILYELLMACRDDQKRIEQERNRLWTKFTSYSSNQKEKVRSFIASFMTTMRRYSNSNISSDE